MLDDVDFIGLHKAILWEQAKGLMRAMVSAGGSVPGTSKRDPLWQEVERRVEEFIISFENDGMHE